MMGFGRSHQTAIAGILVAGMIALGSVAYAGEISGGVVKIGVITDASGPLSDSNGQGSLIAAKLAAEDFQKQHPDIKVRAVLDNRDRSFTPGLFARVKLVRRHHMHDAAKAPSSS